MRCVVESPKYKKVSSSADFFIIEAVAQRWTEQKKVFQKILQNA